MKFLTSEEADNCRGYCGDSKNQVLHNGEMGYCLEQDLLICCCGNDGDYFRIHLDQVLQAIEDEDYEESEEDEEE